MTNPLDIFKEIDNLNFPEGEFVVVGSGMLAVKGIRPAYDLDIVVSKELFKKCKKDKRWELKPWTKTGLDGSEWLKGDKSDLMIEMVHKGESLDCEKLKERGEYINGIYFLSLDLLKDLKKEYGRDKDFEDIVLIDNYLKNN